MSVERGDCSTLGDNVGHAVGVRALRGPPLRAALEIQRPRDMLRAVQRGPTGYRGRGPHRGQDGAGLLAFTNKETTC